MYAYWRGLRGIGGERWEVLFDGFGRCCVRG
jgi:uncharacterized cysteine cluster protein YcgN (CxxCxxCC family)